MSFSNALAHIVRSDDGTPTAVWGPFTLRTAFQPIFAFQEGKLVIAAFEALARPFRNDVGVPPSTFFSSLPAQDRLHVETLTRTLHLVNAGACLPPDTSLFVNFDPSVFVDRSIADAALRDMRQVLNECDIDARRVVCEVTEQKSASQEALYTFVRALRASGFRIAIDDYGSQDSDINRIRDLQPDIVKFDARWIARLMESGPGFALLSTMVDIFARQNILTVFEGLEDNWQLELAERSGASMVQGFVLARPQLAPTSFASFRSISTPAGSESRPPEQPVLERKWKSFGRRHSH